MWMPAVCSICHMRYFMRSPDDTVCPDCRAKKENVQQHKITQNIKPVPVKQSQNNTEPTKITGIDNTPKKEQKEIKTKPKGIQKVCLTCGKVFIAKDNRSKYCSAECRYRYWRPGKKSVKKIKKETVVYHKKCAICGADFGTILPQKIYCSAICAKAAHIQQKYKEKICAHCGASFVTRHKTTKYCPACAAEYMTAKIK